MMAKRKMSRKNRERGISLFMVAVAMVVILGLAALAIDLVSLYLARSEAQRGADAAALAGATIFVNSGCTSSGASCSFTQTAATNEAISVGNQNLVGGVSPGIQTSDVTFNFSVPGDPRITVLVQRTAARGNPMPTFFARILGVTTVDVSATATAEAYNPSGTNGPPIGTYCVKPWLLPNCDPNHLSPANPLCTGAPGGYFIDPTTKAIVNPGPVSQGGLVGQLMTIKPGSPGAATAPSKFFPVILPPGSTPAECPTCSTGGGTGGASLYRQNIECCNTTLLTCGSTTLQPENGNVVGPTRQGVDCLIHEQSNGTGQDILNVNTIGTANVTATGGSSNPNPSLRGQTIPISASNSTVTMPIYDGAQLCPGSSCPASVSANIIGFMQIFVENETNPQGTVNAYIINISSCGNRSGGGGGGAGGGPVTGGGISAVPIRLVQ